MHTAPINVNPPSTTDSIRNDLLLAGIVSDGTWIVHSSMKSLGPVDGGPNAVVRSLIDAIGPEGTLMMSVFTDPQPDGVFDPARTPSRVGLISETFRTYAGVERSLHPTHSVAAFGNHMEWLAGHEMTSGLGAQSPFHRAAIAGAKVLMLGCPITSCSAIHIAEAIEHVPYLGQVWYDGYGRALSIRHANGSLQSIPPIDPPTCSAGFGVVEREMHRRGLITRPTIAQASCMVFHAADAIDVAIELLRKDAGALLCHHSACPVCPRARHLLGVAK